MYLHRLAQILDRLLLLGHLPGQHVAAGDDATSLLFSTTADGDVFLR